MTRYHLPIEVHGDHVHLDVTALPPGLRELVLNELVIDPLRKAGGGEGPDPRFPELNGLVDAVRSIWTRWTTWLGDRLAAAVRSREAEARARLAAQSLDDFELGVVAATTGSTPAPEVTALVRRGDLEPTYPTEAPIPVAVRLGIGLDPRVPPKVPAVPRQVSPAPLTPEQEAAIAYARDRAAIYMRRPVAAVRTAAEAELLDSGVTVDRRLTSVERELVADQIAGALREGRSVAETTRRLREAVHGTNLTNDMERVAITELAFAHGWGGYVALKGRTEPGEDPQVYKIISPAACADCRRIWGPPTNPVLYRLSAVEVFTAAGGNFHRPRHAWGPTIGPTHPRCFPAGVLVTTSAGDLPIERVGVGALVLTHRGRWRRVTKTMRWEADTLRVNGVPVTVDHPFLTSDGRWIEAGALHPGDQIVQPVDVRRPDTQYTPPLGDEVRFLAHVLRSLATAVVPSASVHLDRDALVHQRQVDQEAPDLVPCLHREASLAQHIEHALLMLGLHPSGLTGHHALYGGLVAYDAAAHLMGPMDAVLALLGRHALPHARAGLAPGSRFEAHQHQAPMHHLARDAELAGHREYRHPGVVHRSDPLQVEHMLGMPHRYLAVPVHVSTTLRRTTVHNLSVMDDESYVAEGFVVHNCTCPPLLKWDAAVHDAVQDVAAELRSIYGR